MPRGRPRKNADTLLLKSADLIGWAIGGIEREIVETKNRLSALSAQAAALRKKAGGKIAAAAEEAAGAVKAGRKRKRSKMSPEGRKRISEMMKKRWAERRKAKGK